MAIDPDRHRRQQQELRRLQRGEPKKPAPAPKPPPLEVLKKEEPKVVVPRPPAPLRSVGVHFIESDSEMRKRFSATLCGSTIGSVKKRTRKRERVTCTSCLKKLEA